MPTKEVCKAYQSGQNCRHGDRCKFAHVGEVTPSGSELKKHGNSSENMPTAANGAATSATNPRPVAWGPGSSPSSIVAPRPDGTFAGKLQGTTPPQAPTRTSSAPPSQEQQHAGKKPINVPFKTALQYGASPSSKKDSDNLQTVEDGKQTPPTKNSATPVSAVSTAAASSSSGSSTTNQNRSWASMAAGVQSGNSNNSGPVATTQDPTPSPLPNSPTEEVATKSNEASQSNQQREFAKDAAKGGIIGGGGDPMLVRNNSSGSERSGGKGKGSKGIVCSFWEKGFCRFGESCHNLHPAGAGGEGGKGKGGGKGSSPRAGKGGKGGGEHMNDRDQRGQGSNHHHRGQAGGGAGGNGFNYGMAGIPKGTSFPYAQQQHQQQQMAYAHMMQAVPQWSGGGGGVAMQQHQAMQMMYQQQLMTQQMGGMNLTGRVRSGSGSVTNPQESPINKVSSQTDTIRREIDRGAPQPLMVPQYDSSLVFSVDVECVATGPQHHDRAVAQIGMVDCYGRMILNVLVKPSKPVVSYLTPLTGLTKEKIDTYGQSEEVALAMLRQALPSNAILVGMNIRKDIDWLHLEEKKDFDACIDLADLFRVWNSEKSSYTYFSLEHIAHCWLNVPHTGPGGHDAVMDAFHSMSLFNFYRTIQENRQTLHDFQMKTLSTQVQPSFAKANPVFEGCCMGNRRTCVCGAPFYG